MLMLRYDFRPVTGEWTGPTQNIYNHVSAAIEPDQDTVVYVTPRKEYENSIWSFTSIESGSQSSIFEVE